jgi:ABC-type multidrug transport system ATPase subunit
MLTTLSNPSEGTAKVAGYDLVREAQAPVRRTLPAVR